MLYVCSARPIESYWTIVLNPGLMPVLSTPLPYSTQTEPPPTVIEFGRGGVGLGADGEDLLALDDRLRLRRHEDQAVRTGQTREQDRLGAGLEVDVDQLRADRGVGVVGGEAGDADLLDLVRSGVGQIERAGVGVGNDHVVERRPGGKIGQRVEPHRLVRLAGVGDDRERVVVAAGQDQPAVAQRLQRVRVGQRNNLAGLPGGDVGAGRAVGQDGRELQRCLRVLPARQLLDHRVAGAGRVGVAQVNLAAGIRDVVVAARAAGDGVLQRRADRLGLRIDQAQRRIAVLVLQRPDQPGHRVEFQAVDRAANAERVLDGTGQAVLDDGARPGQAGAIRPVAVFGPERAVSVGERVRARWFRPGRPRTPCC